MKLKMGMTFVAGFATCVALLALVAAKVSPTQPMSDRDVYFPNSESLAPDEMRVIACGTGMPNSGTATSSCLTSVLAPLSAFRLCRSPMTI